MTTHNRSKSMFIYTEPQVTYPHTEVEYSEKWARENPELFVKAFFSDLAKKDRKNSKITIDASRAGFVTVVFTAIRPTEPA